jgi:cleavage and polyadenylation specificity factor subunit 1
MVRCNLDLGLAQILPMFDEETGAEPKIVKASLADPFLLLIRDDASIFVARCDDDNDLEEIERNDDILLTTKWLTGCLYKDATRTFTSIQRNKRSNDAGTVYMFLINAEGTLYVSVRKHEIGIDAYASSGICIA